MKLGDLNPYISLLTAVLLTVNIGAVWTLNKNIDKKMEQLLDSQINIYDSVSKSQAQITEMSKNMQSKFEEQASLFSESSSTATYSPEGIIITTTLIPKEYNTDSKLTVSCTTDGKTYSKEAVQSGSEFVAVCTVPFSENVEISAAIATGESIQQQQLPSIPCQTLLSFDIYTNYSYDDNKLLFTVSNSQNPELLSSLKGIQLAIKRDNIILGNIIPKQIELSELSDSMKGNTACLCYSANLSDYIAMEGVFEIVPIITSSTALKYSQSDSMFSFTVDSEGMDSYLTINNWYPPIFHEQK